MQKRSELSQFLYDFYSVIIGIAVGIIAGWYIGGCIVYYANMCI